MSLLRIYRHFYDWTSGTLTGAVVNIRQATAADLNAQVVGSIAHDATTPGNPVVMGATAETSADSVPANRVSADADVVRLSADRDGALYVHPHGPQIWQYHSNGSGALTDAVVHVAPAPEGGGLRAENPMNDI